MELTRYFSLGLRAVLTGCCLLSCLFLPGQGQKNGPGSLPLSPRFWHLSPRDGLSQSTVTCMHQDKEGFIWLGTEDGLNRYDGHTFLHYRTEQGLGNNFIRAITEDDEGRMWVATEKGIDVLVRPQLQFRALDRQPPDFRERTGRVNALMARREGIWLAADKGLFLIRTARDELAFHSILNVLNAPVYCLDMVNDTLWAASATGVAVLAGQQPYFPKSLSMAVREIALQGQQLWAATADGRILRYDRKSRQAIFYSGRQKAWRDDWVEGLALGPEGTLWVGHYGDGLHLLDAHTLHPVFSFRQLAGDVQSLSSDLIQSLFVSLDGSLWVGTGNSGVDVINLSASRQYFNLIRNDPVRGLPLGVNSVQGVTATSDNHLWLGSDGNGLFELEAEAAHPCGYKIVNHYQQGGKNTIANNYPYGIIQESESVLWIKTWGGLSRFDKEQRRFDNYLTEGSPEGKTSVLAMCKGKDGLFWIGTWNKGIASFDPKEYPNLTFQWLTYRQGQQNTIGSSRVEALHADQQGRLWIGTFEAGIAVLSPSRNIIRNIRHEPEKPHSLSNNSVLCFFQSDDTTLWAGTHGGGLNKIEMESGLCRQYTTADGLPNNVVYGILSDEKGYLWLSTNLGLSRFNPEDGTFWNFDVRDGLQDNEFNRHGFFRSSSGTLFFAGINGVSWFEPKHIRKNAFLPPVVITAIKVNQGPMPVQDNMILRPGQNLIEFEFAVLNYQQPEKNRYRYRLNEGWIEGGNNKRVIYSHLPAGNYEFQVQGANNDGLWNNKGAIFRFTILPPWYSRWWAYAAFISLVIGLAVMLYQFQLSRKLQLAETRRLRELDAFKTRFYTNITHEFRTPLTVILGLAGQALDNSRQKREEAVHLIRRNGQQLLRLVNQMLDLSKAESGSLKARLVQDDIIRFLKYSVESYHSWAEARLVTLRFQAEPDSLAMDFDPEKLQDIFANLLSNALKATPPGGRISVRLSADEQFLSCAVEDTGHGIAPEQLPYVFDRFYSFPPAPSEGGGERRPPQSSSLLHNATADGEMGEAAEEASPRWPSQGNPPPSGALGGAGIGIGLALTKELLQLLEGRIEVRSEPGKGSCFTFYLPIRRTASPSPTLPKGEGVSSAVAAISELTSPSRGDRGGLEGARLLIIEDNADVVYYLRSCLQGRYHIQVAADGQEGIDLALQEVPDIIISDVMMPRRDGLEVCRILKADERTSHIPIILLTARAAIEDKIQGIRRGADAYLSKPFHREELEAQLEQLLQQRRRLQERFRRTEAPVAEAHEKPEAAFLQKVRACILEHLEEENFGVEELARALFLSRTQLFRKVKALTGRNVAAFIHQVRIGRVKDLLANTGLTVAEIAFQTGFSDPSYLRKVFLKETGETLAEFRKRYFRR